MNADTTTTDITAALQRALRITSSPAGLARQVTLRWRPVTARTVSRWQQAPWLVPYGAVLALLAIGGHSSKS